MQEYAFYYAPFDIIYIFNREDFDEMVHVYSDYDFKIAAELITHSTYLGVL